MIDWLLRHLPDPRKMLVLWLCNFALWTALLVPSLSIWRESVVWVVFMSHAANLLTAAGTIVSTCAEIKADPQIEVPV